MPQSNDCSIWGDIKEDLKSTPCTEVEVSKKLNESIFLYMYTGKSELVITPKDFSRFQKKTLTNLNIKSLKIVIHGFTSSYTSAFSQQIKKRNFQIF